MTASFPSDPASDVERVRLLYRETHVPAETLAACLGLAERSFYRRVDAWGWPRRRANGLAGASRCRSGGIPSPRHAEERPTGASRSTQQGRASFETPASRAPQDDAIGSLRRGIRDDATLRPAQAMEQFIAERLAALRAASQSGLDTDPERTARTVAQYARALQVLQQTRARSDKEQTPDEAEPPARSLSELRDELRGHFERIWDETRARRRARAARADAG